MLQRKIESTMMQERKKSCHSSKIWTKLWIFKCRFSRKSKYVIIVRALLGIYVWCSVFCVQIRYAISFSFALLLLSFLLSPTFSPGLPWFATVTFSYSTSVRTQFPDRYSNKAVARIFTCVRPSVYYSNFLKRSLSFS